MSIEIEVTNNDFLTEESAQRLVDIHKCFLHWKDIEAKISGGYFGTHCHICHDSVDICRCVKTQPALVPLDETEILEYIPKVGISTLSKAVHTARAICLRFGKSKESLVSLDGIKMANLIHKTELLDYSRSKNNPRKWNVTSKQALMIAQNICSTLGQVPQRDEVTVKKSEIIHILRDHYELLKDANFIKCTEAIHDRIYGGKK